VVPSGKFESLSYDKGTDNLSKLTKGKYRIAGKPKKIR